MPDERSDAVFLGWLDRHGPVVRKVAYAYTRRAIPRLKIALVSEPPA
jgi:hypothetical protein